MIDYIRLTNAFYFFQFNNSDPRLHENINKNEIDLTQDAQQENVANFSMVEKLTEKEDHNNNTKDFEDGKIFDIENRGVMIS